MDLFFRQFNFFKTRYTNKFKITRTKVIFKISSFLINKTYLKWDDVSRRRFVAAVAAAAAAATALLFVAISTIDHILGFIFACCRLAAVDLDIKWFWAANIAAVDAALKIVDAFIPLFANCECKLERWDEFWDDWCRSDAADWETGVCWFKWFGGCLFEWLFGWLFEWLFGWLFEWLFEWLFWWLFEWLWWFDDAKVGGPLANRLNCWWIADGFIESESDKLPKLELSSMSTISLESEEVKKREMF